ncbi:isocitrate lyase/phosphoenolpyruvate mutase family protein [Streptomyces sp. NPDC012510]|uniref:isocitrate lyase/PEP mutase family protein n=1 Tax=Streptomyces sp. NPDC012510 TaxID=3364838 RepID=UPI0036EE83F1
MTETRTTSAAPARQVDDFRALHRGRAPGNPLILPGPWDAVSARAFAEAGFPALATPSAGVSAALGYADGAAPADEMFAAIARITRAVEIPVSADVEDGYGLPPGELVERLGEAGAVGCNLEDSASGTLKDPSRHADWLAEVRAAAGTSLFVNARVDVFEYGTPPGAPEGAAEEVVEHAIERARLYVAAGADCVYPIGAPTDVLPLLRKEITGPINAYAYLDGPAPRRIGELGATRITFGPGFQRRTAELLTTLAGDLRREWTT